MNPRHAAAEAEAAVETRALDHLTADLTESVAVETALKAVAERLAIVAPFQAFDLAAAYEGCRHRRTDDAQTVRFCLHIRSALKKRWGRVL